MSVNVYKINGNGGIVIPDAKLQEYLNNGWLDEAAWKALCEQKTAEKYQEWLANPDTVQERFQMLRQACESKLAQTDYAMNSDFPISSESKTALLAYRKAIRELNHQTGAPWDGGGQLTPWPTMPTIIKTNN